jgi:hypothetical protein
VILELSHLGAVAVQRLLLDIARLVDLVDDDLRVTVRDDSLYYEGNNDVQPVDQGLVLGAIVGRLVVDLQNVL